MSIIIQLRSLVSERLTAAAEEIFGVFERTIEEYEGEIGRQRQLLDTLEAEMKKTHKTDPPLFSVCEEEVPQQQKRRHSLVQKEPEPLQIKEEQEELWSSEEGEQLAGLEEADVIMLSSTPVPVKSEHNEDKPQSSWFNQTRTEPLASTSTEQMKTEPDGDDCGVSVSNLDPAGDLEPTRGGQLFSSDCSGTETHYSDDWEETGEPQSGLNTLRSSLSNSNKFFCGSSVGPSHEVRLLNQILSETWSCKVCGKCFQSKNSLVCHLKAHPSDCGLCGKHLEPTESLKLHLQSHRTCPICGKTYIKAERHMRSHTGERPYSCTLCHKRFGHKHHLDSHMISHTGEKPYSCTVCHKRFGLKQNLNTHMRIHTGEKPFSCTVCHKRFCHKQSLNTHMLSHTGGNPYISCTL